MWDFFFLNFILFTYFLYYTCEILIQGKYLILLGPRSIKFFIAELLFVSWLIHTPSANILSLFHQERKLFRNWEVLTLQVDLFLLLFFVISHSQIMHNLLNTEILAKGILCILYLTVLDFLWCLKHHWKHFSWTYFFIFNINWVYAYICP